MIDDSLIGEVISDRYRVTERIGTGGMADVYKGQDSVLNRPVAIKVLHKQFAREENFVARFRQEAQAAANLNHPNIVNVYDWGQQDGTNFIVMEYLAGENLKQILQEEGPLPPSRAASIASDVLAALAFAHRKGVVHRDIKPHNIVIDPEGDVKVTDFGIARAVGGSSLTQTGSVLGTAQYISPEQAQGHEVSANSDVYSMGIVLFELLTGQVPFEGDNPVAVALKHVHEVPPKPRSINSKIPKALENVILKALAKHPSRRYRGAPEMKEDLSRFLKGLPVDTPPPDEASAATQVMQAVGAPRQVSHAPKRRRWVPWAIAALVIGFAALAGTWGFLYFLASTQVKVPALEGRTLTAATRLLKKAGLQPIVQRENSDTVAKDIVIRQQPAAGQEVSKGFPVILVVSGGREQVAVPDLTNMKRDDAMYRLGAEGLSLGKETGAHSDTVERDSVIGQNPKPGAKVPVGTKVNLVISRGIRLLSVPGVVGMSQSAATSVLRNAGFEVLHRSEYSSKAAGKVARQEPSAGSSRAPGTPVVIVVSKGPKMVVVRDVVDMAEAAARSTLTSLGFSVVVELMTTADASKVGKVMDQFPNGGESVPEGSQVRLTVGQASP